MSDEKLIEALGLSQDELRDLVVDKLCDRFAATDNEDAVWQRVENLVQEKIDSAVTALAEKHILPNVNAYVENLTLQKTNKWGEKQGKSLTFIEYLVQRAEAYMTEKVDYGGKPNDGGYRWKADSTRVANMVDRHLHYSIETAMKHAVENANDQIVKGIEETVKIKLAEISKSLKMTVKT